MPPRSFLALIAVLISAGAALPRRAMSADTPAPAQPAAVAQKIDYGHPANLDTPRTFPRIPDKEAWETRREKIKRQVLVSCGLYPLPPKTPLRARVFDRVTRDGYTIEKVYFQAYPGFYLAGNLYRPLPKSGHSLTGKQPGILITHGHWQVGRMANTPDGSIPARAITFARMGCVAFTYDMVGYNDTRQIPDHYGTGWAGDREHWLWSVSLMGLQTWNSVRALDFLISLPDVDRSRLAITGESGGGTQTMMLGAIDDRLAAVGPCVMVSHTMQGGCLCENAPGLRVDYSNMEIAAAAGPRPQIMVGATGDWTRTMMTVEGPAVASVYALEGAPDNLKYVIFPYNHNINKTSRDAVYQFFGKVLLHDPGADQFTEPPYTMEPVEQLRVFPDNMPLPADAKSADQLTQYLKEMGESRLEKARPATAAGLAAFKRLYRPLWEQTLHIDPPANVAGGRKGGPAEGESVEAPRPDGGPAVPIRVLRSKANANGVERIAVLINGAGREALMKAGRPGPLADALLDQGVSVAMPELFLQGGRSDENVMAARTKALDNFRAFFTTYNRTDLEERLQDIAAVIGWLRQQGFGEITLIGLEEGGVPAMLAAPMADRVAADCRQMDLVSDAALLSDPLWVPGLRRMGDFRTSLTLAAPHPALLFQTGERFPAAAWLRGVYDTVGAPGAFAAYTGGVSEDNLARWAAAR